VIKVKKTFINVIKTLRLLSAASTPDAEEMAFKATWDMPFSLVLQKLSSFQASSEIFNIVLFMVSYILITGYSILLFMNPMNFKFLQVPAVLFYTFPTASKSKRKEQNNVFLKKTFGKLKNVKKRKKRDQIKRNKRFYIYAVNKKFERITY